MKNLKYILASMAVLAFCACSDVLDRKPAGDNISMDEVLSNPDYVEGLLNLCYGNDATGRDQVIDERGYRYGNGTGFYPLPVSCSDDAWDSNAGNAVYVGINLYYTGSMSASTFPFYGQGYENWTVDYQQIRLCSQFIQYIQDPGTAVKAEKNRGQFEAEARVLRAFFYWDLIQKYGKAPIFTEPVPSDADAAWYVDNNVHRQSAYEIAQQIVADCDYAIANADLPWRITQKADAGRMTKAMAWALKAEAMLYAASPLYNEGQDHWEEAYQQAKGAVDALRANGYKLYTDCTQPDIFGTGAGAAFRQLVTMDADYSSAPRDCETIYQVRENDVDDAGNDDGTSGGAVALWSYGYVGSGMPGTTSVGACPSQELVDAFETTDGQPILNLANPYADEKHLQPNFNNQSIYDEANPYANRDPRFYETVLYNGAHIQFQGEGAETNSIVDYEIQTYVSDANGNPGRHHLDATAVNTLYTGTGYLQCKWVQPGACALKQSNNSRYKYFRFAQSLLALAEAANEAGHTQEALAALNEVRSRVGMPNVTTNNKDELRLRIHNERRVELAWQEDRFYDIRRWTAPTGDLSAVCKWITAMYITKNADGTYNYERRTVSPNPRAGWTNRDLLFPVPQKEAALMAKFTGVSWQNPGW
ncbi:MAG: RagB/SusD family nutrient uptake outer membrane protein [Dysgonamonadaceae bacterium]|nr:RagB/SusD family nutrient uptake outer membrane protein [Dysgonamonadaceae bacterium]